MAGDTDAAITAGLQAAVPRAWGPVLDVVSILGGTLGWILFIGLAFWWSGSRLGVRVALVTSTSALLNVCLKWGFGHPRPYFVSDRLVPFQAAAGFGMPSGHAQGSAALWGALAHWGGRRWLWIAGLVATFLAGAVRVYFGVHSVSQVAWGWLFGAALVVAAAALERPFLRWWARASPAARWSVALLPALLLLGCGLLLRELLYPGQTPPPDWAARHRSAVLRLTPLGVAADLVLLDALALARWAGALLGASLAGLYYGGSAARQVEVLTWRARAIHTLLGLACGGTVLLAGELLVRRVGAPGELLRFALLLLAVGVLAPRVGRRLDRRRAAGANAAPRAVV